MTNLSEADVHVAEDLTVADHADAIILVIASATLSKMKKNR